LANRSAAAAGKLGTFGGVFTPSILTILGLILFLRVTFVVGQAGLGGALLILAIATAISLSTSLSLAAIATNRKVRGGGDYYLISRSLGVSYGGALGLVLFAAQAISVAFYCAGFGEGMAALLPGAPPAAPQLAAFSAAAVVLAVAYLGADLATRFQYAIMAILAAALVSVFWGGAGAFRGELLAESWAPLPGGLGFWALFAIFFPAVTGFTQGVSMSGDLADPARSLPLGTLLAVGVSTLIYGGLMVLLAGGLPASELAADGGALGRVASVSWLVDAGVLAATLSSALASALGAPRILQALARDRVFRQLTPFAQAGNPRRGVLLAGAIALATIWLGNLNAIAGVVSMFFLISYGLLNFATYVEATAASPSFRPRFRFFHARASLAGTVLCSAVMLAIDPVAGAIAVAILVAIYQYVRRTATPVQWRDSQRAYRFRRVKDDLREIAALPERSSEWQPQILVFTESAERRSDILRFASWTAGGAGLITAVRFLEGEGTSEEVGKRCAEARQELQAEIEAQGLEVYPLVVASPDLRAAMPTLLQSWGLGPIRSNTVLVNWLGPAASASRRSAALWYGRALASALRLGHSVVVLDAGATAWARLGELGSEKRRIDVWWFDDESSRLALLLAYLTTRSEEWDEARIRVLVPTRAESAQRTEANLSRRLEESRIEAAVESVADFTLEGVAALCQDAALVLMPLRVEGMRLADPFGLGLEVMLSSLPVVALVAAAQDIRLADEPEIELPAEAERPPATEGDADAGADAEE